MMEECSLAYHIVLKKHTEYRIKSYWCLLKYQSKKEIDSCTIHYFCASDLIQHDWNSKVVPFLEQYQISVDAIDLEKSTLELFKYQKRDHLEREFWPILFQKEVKLFERIIVNPRFLKQLEQTDYMDHLKTNMPRNLPIALVQFIRFPRCKTKLEYIAHIQVLVEKWITSLNQKTHSKKNTLNTLNYAEMIQWVLVTYQRFSTSLELPSISSMISEIEEEHDNLSISNIDSLQKECLELMRGREIDPDVFGFLDDEELLACLNGEPLGASEKELEETSKIEKRKRLTRRRDHHECSDQIMMF